MIRIRFFGPRELIQNGFSAAQYCRAKENPKNEKGKKTKAEVVKPTDLPIAKKHKSMDSDEDDSQPFVPVLTLESRTSSQITGTSCQRQF